MLALPVARPAVAAAARAAGPRARERTRRGTVNRPASWAPPPEAYSDLSLDHDPDRFRPSAGQRVLHRPHHFGVDHAAGPGTERRPRRQLRRIGVAFTRHSYDVGLFVHEHAGQLAHCGQIAAAVVVGLEALKQPARGDEID